MGGKVGNPGIFDAESRNLQTISSPNSCTTISKS